MAFVSEYFSLEDLTLFAHAFLVLRFNKGDILIKKGEMAMFFGMN